MPIQVLVVDDSITVRRVTQRLLKREGFRVALANDGLHALEKLQEEKPAVVLSDIEMPRMDGFDLVRNIRADAALARQAIKKVAEDRAAAGPKKDAIEAAAAGWFWPALQAGPALRTDSAEAKALGAETLKPETSTNYSFGLTAEVLPGDADLALELISDAILRHAGVAG